MSVIVIYREDDDVCDIRTGNKDKRGNLMFWTKKSLHYRAHPRSKLLHRELVFFAMHIAVTAPNRAR